VRSARARLTAEKDTKTPIRIFAFKKNEALRFDATAGAFGSDGLYICICIRWVHCSTIFHL
jgi:hypothetical protein